MRALALLLVVPAVAAAQSPDPGKLAAALKPFVDAGELSGAVAVSGGTTGPLQVATVGAADLQANTPMAADTPFRLASMTKPVTAVAVLTLVDTGKLQLDDPVEKHLPEFRGQMLVTARGNGTLTLGKPARPVAVRDLLTHTGGLANNYGPGFPDAYTRRPLTLKETTLLVSQRPLEFAPGSKWSYCNPGIDTLGRLVEVLGGTSYESYVQRTVFDPLGMTATTFKPTAEVVKRAAVVYDRAGDKLVPSKNVILQYGPDVRHPVPAGGLVGTGPDYARFLRMLLNKGELDGKRVLSPESVAEMTRVQTGELSTGFVPGMGFGLGVGVVRQPQGVTENLSAGSFGHGGAFGTQGWADPTGGKFVVLLIARTGLPNGDASAFRRAVQAAALR